VSRSPSKDRSNSSRLRALPWAGLLQVGYLVGRRVSELSARDRERLGALLRDSKGIPGNLGQKERRELRKLVGKLDLVRIGRDALPLLRGPRRRR
jgi:hypothetical protein